MTGKEISERIKKSERKTPVKAYISSVVKPMLPKCRIFGENGFFVAFGAWEDMEKSLAEQSEIINIYTGGCGNRQRGNCNARRNYKFRSENRGGSDD